MKRYYLFEQMMFNQWMKCVLLNDYEVEDTPTGIICTDPHKNNYVCGCWDSATDNGYLFSKKEA